MIIFLILFNDQS